MSLFTSKTKSEIEKLIEENDELKNTLHEILQNHQSINDLERKLTETRKELSDSLKLIDKSKNDLQSIMLDIKSQKEKENELTEKNKILSESKESLESSISSLEITKKEYDAQKEESHTLKRNYNELYSEYQNLKDQYSQTKQNLELMQPEEEKLKNLVTQFGGSNISESVLKMKELEEELIERINYLKSEESKRIASIKILDEKITLSEDIKSNLETSLSAIVGELSEKEKMFTEYFAKKEAMLDEIREKQKAYDEIDTKHNFIKEYMQNLELESKELLNKKEGLLTDIIKFESVKNEIQDKILQLKKEEEVLSEALSVKKQISEELEKKKLDFDESHLKIENNLVLILQKFAEELNSTKENLSSIRQQIIDKDKELNEKEKILLEKTTHIVEYGGMAKVLQKERSAAEKQVVDLKEERDLISNEILLLKDDIVKKNMHLQQLGNETNIFSTKKETLEKEIRGILQLYEDNLLTLTSDKQIITQEIMENTHHVDELKNKIDLLNKELRDLKNEIANAEKKKEEYTAKVSELIAMEKNLKHRISENEKKLENTQS